MDREKLRRTLCNLAKRATGDDPGELSDGDVLLEKIKVDSFSFVSLVLEIEERFDISVGDEEVQTALTVGSLLDLILAKIGKAAEPPPPLLPVAQPPVASAPRNAIQAAVRAVGYVDLPIAEVAEARERLAVEGKDVRAQSVMRLCEEQTVLGALAIKDAMRRGSIAADEMMMWNLIASSRFLGRLNSVAAWRRYQKVGPNRISPLLIPFVSLHAGASVLSLFFDIHGPTFGVGGCADNVSEGLMTGLTVPISAETPGTWVVFTGWEPEPIPNDKGETQTPSHGYAVAIALTATSSQANWQMAYEMSKGSAAGDEYPSLRAFVEGLSRLHSEPCRIHLSAGGTLIIEKVAHRQRVAA